MTEFETDPPRPPANAGGEPSHPTAELPGVDRGQSDSGDTLRDPRPSADAGVTGAPAGSQAPAAASAPAGTEATAARSAAPRPGALSQPAQSGPQPQPGPQPGQSPAAPAGLGTNPAAGPVAASPWQGPRHQQPAPHQYHPYQPAQHQHHQPGWPGQPAAQHGTPYQPYPPVGAGPVSAPWAPPPGTAGPAGKPSRVGRFAAIGAAALVLMLGSGVAGGVIALAVDDGPQPINRTYSAAPVINPADLPGIAKKVQDSVVSIDAGNSGGSGVVMTPDGFILTNNHVVANARRLQVFFADGKSVAATVVGTDPRTDLAVIKAEDVSGLSAATFGDSDAMQVGDTVLALGSPLGLQGSVTAGIISARDRTIQTGQREPSNPFDPEAQGGGATSISGLLQTDAAINPGNSGGALVNTRGEVIGINTAIATAGQSSGNIGVGFAIPSNKAKDVAEALKRGEKISHPYLGVRLGDAEGGGALIGAVEPDGPAAKAGLQRGDVVIRFGDKQIGDATDLAAAVQAGKVGDRVQVTYIRNGVEKTATVTLAEAS